MEGRSCGVLVRHPNGLEVRVRIDGVQMEKGSSHGWAQPMSSRSVNVV